MKVNPLIRPVETEIKTERIFALVIFPISLLIATCSSPAATSAPVVTDTESSPPTATLSPEPLTPTPTILDLEIVEWYEHAIPNLVDPSITDTQVEVLIHNPNDFPVRVNTDEDELRFLNAEGDVVYTNEYPTVMFFEGEWITAGQNAAYSACVCFQTQGLEKQEWVTLELVAPIEVADDVAYTTDVEVTAEFVLLEEVTPFNSGPGVATTLTNNSDQVLESIPILVFARDASGRYVGMANFGSVSFTENIGIQPGDTTSGLAVSYINYLGNERLTYEVQAIGIIAQGVPTEWQGIPIMPGAISGGEANDGYEFSTQASTDEITQFYEAALAELGYSLSTSGTESGVTFLIFQKGSSQAIIAILPSGELNRVQIKVSQ